jgi:glucosamine--fructose-6-phosphate aminotransferase (isomerizing)
MFLTTQMIGALLSGQDETLNILKTSPAVVKNIVRSIEPSIEFIFRDHTYQNIFYLGSGPFYGAARDATLKMMEMSLSEVLCFPFLESRHGPKSLIDENSLVIGLFSQAGQRYEAQLMGEYTLKHHATTVAVIPDSSCDPGDVTFRLPTGRLWPDSIQALAYLPVVQLLAYYRALSKEVNPDLSRNLTQFIEIPQI